MSTPLGNPAPAVVSIAPLALAAPARGLDLDVRVAAPVGHEKLPVIIFSHGFGQSLSGYRPLVDHWTASGFIVIQPTHLNSHAIGLAPTDPRTPDIWRHREQDLLTVLDNLAGLEAAIQPIGSRFDFDRIAVAGHSWGATTASVLLGATRPDPDTGRPAARTDPRVKAGILLALAGTGGPKLSPFAAQHFLFINPGFSEMTTPALIVAGDADQSPLSTVGPEWWREAYDLSPGSKALFTALGGQHSLGGVSGYQSTETTDESPGRVAAIQQLSTAFLRRALNGEGAAWSQALATLASSATPQGKVETK